MIRIVVTRPGLGAILVTVLADVKVEVEEAGAELAVPVPVAGSVKAETADTDDGGHAHNWTGKAEHPNHGSTRTIPNPCSLHETPPQAAWGCSE